MAAEHADSHALEARFITPSEGERRAAIGYRAQYRVAAHLILNSLLDGTLQWIRVLDPVAGRVDDVVIGKGSRVDAYQVKWEQRAFTFRNLAVGAGGAPPLIAQLADGWRRLRQAHISQRVVVHLITSRTMSINDRPPAGEPLPVPRNFAAFLEQAWRPYHDGLPGASPVPAAWRPAWDALRLASGLSEDEFGSFVHDCVLEFGYHVPTFSGLSELERQTAESDIAAVADFLFEAAAGGEHVLELTRNQLIARLGWEDRLRTRVGQNFPVDEEFYEPITDTVSQLQSALNDLGGGYLAVLGPPGCGKSTLLTQTLRSRPERVITYYAHLPASGEPAANRGESVNFLRHVVAELENAGFRSGQTLPLEDRILLLERLHGQLGLLHDDWRQTGRRTFILVDGLDHIARELRPERSLLADLPQADEIPEGVLIVVGSQTDQLAGLSPSVQHAIQQPARRIEMDRLSREAVLHIVDRVLGRISHEQKERVRELSGGHPLALMILLNRLRDAVDGSAIDDVLEDTVPYSDDIKQQYHAHWRQMEGDHELTILLGLLARIRGVIDLTWVESWAGRAVVDRLRRSVAHYFRADDPHHWFFFHESFRIYVLQKTQESEPGILDPARDRQLHHELAERCAETSPASPWRYEELYHRSAAEEHEAVLQLASQDWFRDQFLGLRPPDAIDADIKLALKSAEAQRDPVALARLLLAGSELAQRTFHLEESPLTELLTELEPNVAAVYIRDGNRLRVDPGVALNASVGLNRMGLEGEAARVFQLAEPLDLLGSSGPIEDTPHQEKAGILEGWIKAAVHFKDLQSLVTQIRNLRLAGDRFNDQDDEATTRSVRRRLLHALALELLESDRWDDFGSILTEFDTAEADGFHWWFSLQVHAWRHAHAKGDRDRAKALLETALGRSGATELGPEDRVLLAEGVFRILRDVDGTRHWLEGISQPSLRTDIFTARDSGLSPFAQRFRLNRMLYALGDERSPAEIVPDMGEPKEQGVVSFERALCVVARIWGLAWRGQQLLGAEIANEALPLLRLFNRDWRETRDWTSWYVIQGARREFFGLLVDAVGQYGADAIEALRATIEREWSNSATGRFWHSSLRRHVVLAFREHHVSSSWVTEQLAALDHKLLEAAEVYSRIEECQEQARAWMTVRDTEAAKRSLRKMLEVSFSVGVRKDYQLDTWIGWLKKANEVNAGQAAQRISWLARAIPTLQESTEGAAGSAANELLEATVLWSPRRAVQLLRFFLDRGIIDFEGAIKRLLRSVFSRQDLPASVGAEFLACFVIPLTTSGDPGLTRSVIQQISASGRDAALRTAQSLLDRANMYALPSARPAWRQGLAEALSEAGVDTRELALDWAQVHSDDDGWMPRWLKLRDGTAMNLGEIIGQVRSAADLEALRAQEDPDGHFDWLPVVASLAQTLEGEDLALAGRLFEGSHRHAMIVATLSEALSDRGRMQDGWSMGEQALASSKAYGWDRSHDGGSRHAAFRALVRAEASRGRDLAWKTLVSDLSGEFPYPQNVVLNLHEILPILCEEVPVGDVWTEVEILLRSLFATAPILDSGPNHFQVAPPHENSSRAIVDVLGLFIDHPVSALARAAATTLLRLILAHEPAAHEVAGELLVGSDSQQEGVLAVLHAASLQDRAAVTGLADGVGSLAGSRNIGIRRAARKILEELHVELPSVTGSITTLPSIYALALPPQAGGALAAGTNISPGEPLPDTSDPVEIMGPWYGYARGVAGEAGVPVINVCYRAVEIMRDLAPEDSWKADGERSLREMLEAVGLRLAFRRPRSTMARRALFHVIGELLDAGRLSGNSLVDLDWMIRFYDPAAMLFEPRTRPTCIPQIERMDLSRENERWVAQVQAGLENVRHSTEEGLRILAEDTSLRWLEWGAPNEIRRSGLTAQSPPISPAEDDFEQPFERVVNLLIKEYSGMRADVLPSHLIIRHDAYGYESPAENWLALSPVVGTQMGWRSAEDGLFQWVDTAGRMMVESVWWIDGPVGQAPPHFKDEVGEGWLVVASEQAWDALMSRFDDFQHLVYVKRSYQQNGSARERTAWQLRQ